MFFIKTMMLLWLILLLTVVIYWIFFRQTRLRLPGPRGLPILGSVLQIDSARSHLTLTTWAQQYGPVFVVNMFREQMVIINGYEGIYDAVVRKGEEFSDSSKVYRCKLISRGYKDIICASTAAPHWRVLRKAAHTYLKVYSRGVAAKFEELIGGAVKDQMERMAKYEGQPFNVRQELYDFVACIMHLLLLGERLGPNSEEVTNIKEINEGFIANLSIAGSGVLLDVFPWLRFFRNKTYCNIMKANDEFDVFWDSVKLKLSLRDQDEQPDCFLKYLLNLKDSLKTDQGEHILDETNVKLAMLNLIAAGSTTTTAALSAFILLLLHHPNVQRELQEEVDRVVGHHNKVTLAQRDAMPYTRAAIYELLRYATVGPLIGRATLRDTTLEGAFIPKGTNVVINVWQLHHDEAFWRDPWNFRPERYLDNNGDLLPADHPNRKRLLAFGAGPRVCLGEVFTLNRMFLFIASMTQRFDVTMDTTKELPPCDPRTYVNGLVLHPADFTLCMVPRANSLH